jgi:hypothetical protein
MQLVNGAGTQSYRQCINTDCKTLPTNVLRGRHRQGYAIQILFCNSHESDAIAVSLKDFKGIFFEGIPSPRWLKGAQGEELKAELETVGKQWLESAKRDETQSRARKES